jgi:hypothetical protein
MLVPPGCFLSPPFSFYRHHLDGKAARMLGGTLGSLAPGRNPCIEMADIVIGDGTNLSGF